MAAEIQEVLLYAQQNVSELRKLGREWGLSNRQINNCIQKSLSMKLDGPDTSDRRLKAKFQARITWSKFRICVFTFLGIFGVFFFAAVTAVGMMAYQANSIHPSKFLHPYAYTIFRPIRLAGAGMQRFLSRNFGVNNLHEYYDMECIVENPYFAMSDIECDICKDTKQVEETDERIKPISATALIIPTVHRGTHKPIHLSDIRTVVKENERSLRSQMIMSSSPWATFVGDLGRDDLLDKIIQEDAFSCVWNSMEQVFQGRIMRELFSRPNVLPPDMEVGLQKHIFIDGAKAFGKVLVDSKMGGYSWYIQGSGSRTVKFSPFKECQEICEAFQTTLQEGDMLTFPSAAWEVQVEDNTDEISVAFLGFLIG